MIGSANIRQKFEIFILHMCIIINDFQRSIHESNHTLRFNFFDFTF